ncbi:MAG: desulfoferrodoxin family protein [Bacillota bacterium]|nr:desulfoferrodoxin family protein [Bacillota bacterium]
MKIYICEKCGEIVMELKKGGKPFCCGQAMKALNANSTDAATEKHVPVVTKEDGKLHIRVGSVDHPMTEEHSIEWVAAVGDQFTMMHRFQPGEAPDVTVCDRGAKEVYAYCNLHGLWKVEL